MSDYTIVEKYQQNKKSNCCYTSRFLIPIRENMGLEKYGPVIA